jgi:hypothetical protein
MSSTVKVTANILQKNVDTFCIRIYLGGGVLCLFCSIAIDRSLAVLMKNTKL